MKKPLRFVSRQTTATNAMALMLLCHLVSAQAVAPTQIAPVAQFNLDTTFPKQEVRLIGLTPYGTAIIVAANRYNSGAGFIVRWDVSKKMAIGKIPFSKQLDGYDLKMSFDGRWLVTNNNREAGFSPFAHRIVSLRSSNLQVAKTHILKDSKSIRENTSGYLFAPDDSRFVVMKMISKVPNPKTRAEEFDRDTFQWLNLATGKRDKMLAYNPARGCDRIIFSPDKKYLLCLFSDERADLSNDPKDLTSIIDVLDAKTGKIVWHIQGTSEQPAGAPLFFISPTRFIAYGTVFNIPQKKARLWNAVNPTRRCLEVVPGNSRYAMFLTKSGLQLRDWKTDRALAIWPTVTKPGRILFSPDLKTFAFRWGQNVQFWKFDSKWLK